VTAAASSSSAATADLSALERAAAESAWTTRIAEFTRWVSAAASPSGRKLTQTGRLTLADARTLMDRLGTGDVSTR
jgi:hypothetical protein